MELKLMDVAYAWITLSPSVLTILHQESIWVLVVNRIDIVDLADTTAVVDVIMTGILIMVVEAAADATVTVIRTDGTRTATGEMRTETVIATAIVTVTVIGETTRGRLELVLRQGVAEAIREALPVRLRVPSRTTSPCAALSKANEALPGGELP